MTAEGGFEVAFHGEYREIVPNEKLVNTEIFEGDAGGRRGARDLHVRGDRVGPHDLSMLTKVDSQEIRDRIIASGMEGGAQEGLDILEEIAIELNAA